MLSNVLLTGMNCQMKGLDSINMHAIVLIFFWARKIIKITEIQIKIMNIVFQLHAIHSSIRKIMITPIMMKTPKMISTSSPTMIMTNKKYSVIVLISWLELYLDNSGSEISGSRLDCPYLGFCRELSNRK